MHETEPTFSGEDKNYSRGHNEEARRQCIKEFIDSIRENKPPSKQRSNFFEHKLSTRLLSAVYESGSKDFSGKVNIIKGKI